MLYVVVKRSAKGKTLHVLEFVVTYAFLFLVMYTNNTKRHGRKINMI